MKPVIFGLFMILALPFASKAETGVASKCANAILGVPQERGFVAAAATECCGYARSFIKMLVFRVSREKFCQELRPFFGAEAGKHLQVSVDRDGLVEALDQIDSHLTGEGFAYLRASNKGMFLRWSAVAKVIGEQLQPSQKLSDFVVFQNGQQILFVRQGGSLVPLEVSKDGKQTLIVPNNGVELKVDSSLEVSEELAIRTYAQNKFGAAAFRLRKMSAATNDMRYPRDRMFDWEGEFITRVTNSGGRTNPNFKILLRFASREALAVDSLGRASIDPEVLPPLRTLFDAVRRPGEDFDVLIGQHTERLVYHTLLLRYFDLNPQIVLEFMKSETFVKFAKEFINKHLAYVGATQFDVAKGMLAGVNLYQLEVAQQGVKSLAESNSLHYFADMPQYQIEISSWLAQARGEIPRDSRTLVGIVGSRPFQSVVEKTKDLSDAIKAANDALPIILGQIRRHPSHNWFSEKLARYGWITDPRRSFPNNVMANLMLAKAEGAYVITAYFDPMRAHGYLGPNSGHYEPLPSFVPSSKVPTAAEASIMLAEIVNNQTFEGQRDAVVKYAPELSAYLISGENVPETVRSFAKTLYSDDFQIATYQKLGKNYDPNAVNRFFPDSFSEFQKMNMYRYLFDMAFGMTGVLVQQHLGYARNVERVLSNRWRPYNFSFLSQRQRFAALSELLRVGSNRILTMRHQPVDEWTAVDVRQAIEIWFGWDAYDTKFLRWANYHDEWDMTGVGWNCLCFIRNPVFNPNTVIQF